MAPPCHIACDSVWARLTAPPDATELVREALTVDDPAAKYTRAAQIGRWDGKQRFFQRPSNRFLAGLRWRVQEILETHGYVVTVDDAAPPPRDPLAPRLLRSSLRPYQEKAVEAVMAQGRATLQSATGSGKTVIATEIVRRLGYPALWIVPRRKLMTQTADVIRDELGIPVGMIGDGIRTDGPVIVAVINSLVSGGEAGLPPRTVLIVDEVHHAPSETWAQVIQASVARVRIGLSGTAETRTPNPVRAMRLEGLLGPVIRAEDTMTLVSQGFLANPRVTFLAPSPESYPLYSEIREIVLPDWRRDPKRLVKMGAKLFDETERLGIVENDARNRLLLNMAYRHVVKANDRVLILCHTIPHSERLTGTWRQTVRSHPVWRVDGKTPLKELDLIMRRFRDGSGGGLLVATPFFREGIDIPEIDALILAGGGMSEIVSIQSIGRALRPRPDKQEVMIYDCWDGRRSAVGKERERDYLADHADARLRTYHDQKFEVTR